VKIPQNIFQHLNGSYLQRIDLKQNNLIEINGNIFQNLNHLNNLVVAENNISHISYSGLHSLSFQNLYSVIHYGQFTQMVSKRRTILGTKIWYFL
jgi:hypothetical protein